MKYVPLRYLFIGFMLALLIAVSLLGRYGLVSADSNQAIPQIATDISTADLASAESVAISSSPVTITQVYLALHSIIPDIAGDLRPQTEYCMDLILTAYDNGYQPQEKFDTMHLYLSHNFDEKTIRFIDPLSYGSAFPVGLPDNGSAVYQDGTWQYEGVFDSPSIAGTNYLRWSYLPGSSGVSGDAPFCEADTSCIYRFEHYVCATTKPQIDANNRWLIGTGYSTDAQNADALMYEIPRMLTVSLTDKKVGTVWLTSSLLIALLAGLIVTTATLRRR